VWTLKLTARMFTRVTLNIIRKVKVYAPSFDRKIYATTFSDRIDAMKHYFDWYEMSDIERVRFAKIKVIRPARKS